VLKLLRTGRGGQGVTYAKDPDRKGGLGVGSGLSAEYQPETSGREEPEAVG
jgi:hypothetical protein